MTATALQDQISEAAQDGKIGQVEDLWIELLDAPPEDPQFYADLCREMARARAQTKAQELVVMALDELADRSAWSALAPVIQVLAPHWPSLDPLRRVAERTLRGLHASNPNLDQLIAHCGITGETPVDRAIAGFDDLLLLSPGEVYLHSSWGAGILRSAELVAGKVIIDFPTERGKSMTLEGVRKFLTYLEPTHILARKARQPEELKALAKSDPAELVKCALRSFDGRLKQADLKALITGSVIGSSSWTGWWTRARKKLQVDPFVDIESTGGARAEITLRDEPRSLHGEIEELFFGSDTVPAKRAAAIQRLAELESEESQRIELAGKMANSLAEAYRASGREDPVQAIEMAFSIEDLRAIVPKIKDDGIPKPADLLADVTDYGMLTSIENADHARRALELLIQRDGPEGVVRATAILPASSESLAQSIWERLDAPEHHEAAAEAVQFVIDRPLANPLTYLWAMKAILQGNWKHLEDYFPLESAVVHLLDDLEDWYQIGEDASADREDAAKADQLTTRGRTLLSARKYAPICDAALKMTLVQAQRLRKTIQDTPALIVSFKSAALKSLVRAREDLDSNVAMKAPAEQNFNYCTARARVEITNQLRELTSVKIPAVTKAIEEARREGDLKENAGYIYAKEEQKMLIQKTLQLQDALGSLRVIGASSVNADAVGFGTTFEAENMKTGENETYTILSRWEANAEKNVLSIQAPLPQQFLGKTVGDEVEVIHPGGGETPYRILSIINALESGEWDEKEGAGSE